MKARGTLCALIAIVLSIFVPVVRAARDKRVLPVPKEQVASFTTGDKVAVVVGVGAYAERSGLGKLDYAARDAQQIKAVLEAEGYLVSLLTDTEAIGGVVLNSLEDVEKVLSDPGDSTVLFYFSGHGFREGEVNYLATYDSVRGRLSTTGLSLSDVEAAIKATGARRQVLLIDACRDEPGVDSKSGASRSFTNFSMAAGLRALFSTKAGELSYESADLQHGVFTYYVLEGLRGNASGEDGLVTFDDLAAYVLHQVRSWGFSRSKVQVPYEAGEAAGDFLLARPNKGAAGVGTPGTRPSLQVTSKHTYVVQGGSEVVTYRVDESSVRDGVSVGEHWFPGYPVPGGGEGQRFALFGVPFDHDDPGGIRLIAEDAVGNRAEASFVDRFSAKPIPTDTIRLSEAFMARVVPAILTQEPSLGDRGSLFENFLMINRDLRRQNDETLRQLAKRSTPDFLWSEVFLQMRNAHAMSPFAGRRTYTFEGEAVDQQDHVGIDLASTRVAEIPAANAGTVVLARYLGIYGNAVVIDHGYGLMTLYGHLSSLTVDEGQAVARGQVIGRSGETGLAGGDHLHFTTMLHGLPVTPLEWWDGHWIADRLKLKLGNALPFDPGS